MSSSVVELRERPRQEEELVGILVWGVGVGCVVFCFWFDVGVGVVYVI